MAKMNLKYYTEKDYYSDGSVEEEILDIVNSGKDINSLPDKKYAVLYHLSDIRENILNWYPFDEEASVLEIGAGCGAITGALCRRANKVVSVELSKRRATINYNRHKDAENLEIFVGNLNDMSFDEQFDYAVVNGVLEYAESFTESENPYVDFIKQISKHIKERGKIIIAIENRFGLKYFAGAPEDHTNGYFHGINGYEGISGVRTFSKKELEQLLVDSGLPHYEFYYPYPDYKFPNEIFTEESLRSCGYGRDYFNLNGERYILFDESKVAGDLVKEGVMEVFSNSFLVVASAKEIIADEKILYAKLNNDRADSFKIMTTISRTNGELIVRKMPMKNSSIKHIDDMIKNSQRDTTAGMSMVASLTKENCFEYKYIDQPTLNENVLALIEQGDKAGVIQQLDMLFQQAFSDKEEQTYGCEQFISVFGDEGIKKQDLCMKNANIDLICDNIFVVDGEYKVIDCEWVFPFYIPVNFIMWRTINELYNKHHRLADLISLEDMLARFGVSKEDEAIYYKWHRHFAEEYVGCNSLEKYNIPKNMMDLQNVQNRQGSTFSSFMYVDIGEGFSEEYKLSSTMIIHNGSYEVSFEIPSNWDTKRVRWEPIKNYLIDIKLCDITANTSLNMGSNNAYRIDEENYRFLSYIPQIELFADDNIQYVKISGEISFVDFVELEAISNHYMYMEKSMQSMDEELNRRQTELNNMQIELNRLQQENDYYKNTLFRRVVRKLKGK